MRSDSWWKGFVLGAIIGFSLWFVFQNIARGEKTKIPCVYKNARGQFRFNKEKRSCIQYTRTDEVAAQKRLIVLKNYIEKKEPIWREKEKRYKQLEGSYKKSEKERDNERKLFREIIESKDKQVGVWRKAFLDVKKLAAPPEKRFWENPWFWSTAIIVVGLGAGVIAWLSRGGDSGGQNVRISPQKGPQSGLLYGYRARARVRVGGGIYRRKTGVSGGSNFLVLRAR